MLHRIEQRILRWLVPIDMTGIDLFEWNVYRHVTLGEPAPHPFWHPTYKCFHWQFDPWVRDDGLQESVTA